MRSMIAAILFFALSGTASAGNGLVDSVTVCNGTKGSTDYRVTLSIHQGLEIAIYERSDREGSRAFVLADLGFEIDGQRHWIGDQMSDGTPGFWEYLGQLIHFGPNRLFLYLPLLKNVGESGPGAMELNGHSRVEMICLYKK